MSRAELLEFLGKRMSALGEAGPRRVSLELRGEVVSITSREVGLSISCTCGAETCVHQTLAVNFFGDVPDEHPTNVMPTRARPSARPMHAVSGPARAVADSLSELCLATARAGIGAQDSPSIRAALDQLIVAAPQPTPLALARFVGRFQSALALGEVGMVARLLAGAQAWAADFRSQAPSPSLNAATRAWLGLRDGELPASLTDSLLAEVGREWLAGLTRSAIERRYLVDLASGELFCEERRRGDQDISVGPCPRLVHVAFAELETAVTPRRARLLQYTVTPELTPEQYQRLSELASSTVAQLVESFAAALAGTPGLAEPVVLFAPRSASAAATGSLRDEANERLEMWDDQGSSLAETVRTLIGDGELVWVLGRLRGLRRGLVLRPISLLLRTSDGYRLRRIT